MLQQRLGELQLRLFVVIVNARLELEGVLLNQFECFLARGWEFSSDFPVIFCDGCKAESLPEYTYRPILAYRAVRHGNGSVAR